MSNIIIDSDKFKSISKRLNKHLPDAKLSDTQELLAQVMGFRNLHGLQSFLGGACAASSQGHAPNDQAISWSGQVDMSWCQIKSDTDISNESRIRLVLTDKKGRICHAEFSQSNGEITDVVNNLYSALFANKKYPNMGSVSFGGISSGMISHTAYQFDRFFETKSSKAVDYGRVISESFLVIKFGVEQTPVELRIMDDPLINSIQYRKLINTITLSHRSALSLYERLRETLYKPGRNYLIFDERSIDPRDILDDHSLSHAKQECNQRSDAAFAAPQPAVIP